MGQGAGLVAYLDNAATTPALPEVAEAVRRALLASFANPSSVHRWGLEAERLLRQAREVLARGLGCDPGEVLFTSGGTEANNTAVLGAARARRREGRHCVTSAIEHRSVLQAFAALEGEGFEVTYLPPDRRGVVAPEAVAAALRPDTILVSLFHVNNEVGSVNPVQAIGRAVASGPGARGRAWLHVDAVQSFGKLPVDVGAWRADLVTVSAHKIHGPKGVGALFVRRGTRIAPLHLGGEQEGGLRPGTENVPGIAGFGVAAESALQAREEAEAHMRALKARLWEGIRSAVDGVQVNGPDPGEGAPHILNLAFPGLRGEVLLHALEGEGVAVSTGSACSARRPEPSHVLVALGLPRSQVEGAIRFSLSRLTTPEEVDAAAAAVGRAVARLRRVPARR